MAPFSYEMETPTKTLNRNGYASSAKYIVSGQTVTNRGTTKHPQSKNRNDKSYWRYTFWTVAILFTVFAYVQSVNSVWTIAAMMGVPLVMRVALAVSVSAAEGIIVAWLTCPQLSLVTKRQEKQLRIGMYIITILQVIEIGFMYGYVLGGGGVMLWCAGIATVFMLVTAVIVAKNVIQHDAARVIAMEQADTRRESAVADAKIAAMKAKHELKAKQSIIDVENAVIARERGQALAMLNTKEAETEIKTIGVGRAMAVIRMTKQNMDRYAVKMLASKSNNTAVNPRQVQGSRTVKK